MIGWKHIRISKSPSGIQSNAEFQLPRPWRTFDGNSVWSAQISCMNNLVDGLTNITVASADCLSTNNQSKKNIKTLQFAHTTHPSKSSMCLSCSIVLSALSFVSSWMDSEKQKKEEIPYMWTRTQVHDMIINEKNIIESMCLEISVLLIAHPQTHSSLVSTNFNCS